MALKRAWTLKGPHEEFQDEIHPSSSSGSMNLLLIVHGNDVMTVSLKQS